jgi:hypothetical protein
MLIKKVVSIRSSVNYGATFGKKISLVGRDTILQERLNRQRQILGNLKSRKRDRSTEALRNVEKQTFLSLGYNDCIFFHIFTF